MTTTRAASGGIRLYRMLTWLSPGFPVGAFSYSHGLEAAVENGAVRERSNLQAWIAAVVTRGSGRVDADILRDAHRAAEVGDFTALTFANHRGLAYRATAEMALETTAQGAAFLAAGRSAWPDTFSDRWSVHGEAVCYPAAVGIATGRAGIPIGDALLA